MLAALCFAPPLPEHPPVIAEAPSKKLRFIAVDIAVINHIRHRSTHFDPWGKPIITVSKTVWVSFFDRCYATVIPVGLVGRGWVMMSRVVLISRADCGWLFETKNGIIVLVQEIRIIDSNHDWEMKNRFLFWQVIH